MTNHSPDSTTGDNVIDFLDYKARRLYPDMPERLRRAAMIQEWVRLIECGIIPLPSSGLVSTPELACLLAVHVGHPSAWSL